MRSEPNNSQQYAPMVPPSGELQTVGASAHARDLEQLRVPRSKQFSEELLETKCAAELEGNICTFREPLFALASKLIRAFQHHAPSSVVTEGSGAKFVARFIHGVLARCHDMDITRSVLEPKPAGWSWKGLRAVEEVQRELVEQLPLLGKRPLVVTEFIQTGSHLGVITPVLLAHGLRPTVGTLLADRFHRSEALSNMCRSANGSAAGKGECAEAFEGVRLFYRSVTALFEGLWRAFQPKLQALVDARCDALMEEYLERRSRP